ncbi:MAG: peptidoglycan DD-metalloendopeptidase family protein [Gammaproteobacteria bacterium]
MTMRSAGLLLVAIVFVAGCSSMLSWEQDTYTVKRGDTLQQIAWKFGLDTRELAAWNDLGDGNLIHPGQKIHLSAPSGWKKTTRTTSSSRSGSASSKGKSTRHQTVAKPPSEWVWPSEGRLASTFGQGSLGGKGINIAGQSGQPVLAAASGEVVYSGSGLIGYGKLIIVKHNETFLSAYGHNNDLVVREGDRVKVGQTIARMGDGPDRRPILHFEIRLNGKPVDPMKYLPKR